MTTLGALALEAATPADLPAILDVRVGAARALGARFGAGHWAREPSAVGVERAIARPGLFVGRRDGEVVGTVHLVTKKPWAIDPSHFTDVPRALYLVDMAVHPAHQRCGFGRAMLAAAEVIARAWPADAIRLDAYDAPAGAGGFYANCGYQACGRVTYRRVPLIYFERRLAPVAAGSDG